MPELTPDELVLEVGGQLWRGWTELSVSRSIEAVAGSFELTLTDLWEAGRRRRIDVHPGAACRILVEGPRGAEPLITGHVDEVAPAYDAGRHQVRISGRDAAGDLVDCSAVHAPSGEWQDSGLHAIATDLCRPFGIPVWMAVAAGPAFASFRIQEGETVWECLERACRMRQVLAISDGRGGIVITRPGQARRSGHTLAGPGAPILRAEGSSSLRDRHSAYIVKGQGPLADLVAAEDAAGAQGTASDPGVRRHRPLIVVAEDSAAEGALSLEGRARFEAAVREGRSRRITLTLAGWRDAAGALWQPLTTLRLADEFLAVDAELLVAGVAFARDANAGSTATLTLTGRHAFDVLPLAESEDMGW